VLSVNGLGKRFQLHVLGGKVIEGCRGVSFEVPAGSFLGLAGPSGAGKSTILKCIYRTYLASEGSIVYRSASQGEVDLARAPERTVLELRRREVGYVSQFLRAIPRVSALDLVAQPLLGRGEVGVEDARGRAAALLERLAIPRSLLGAYPATFSGGEQQRVNIARAVIWAPRLLLLDEPTASLDRRSVEAVLQLLGELRRAGSTMIGIFHDPALIASTADRILAVGAPGAAHG
jgi:alpha-D-ribose 1-methylphosphonate 5-triphosphate synthase subunit PhnL